MLSKNEVTEGLLIAVFGANFVLLFFIAWHMATARLFCRQVRQLAITITEKVRKMDCEELIDDMLSCSRRIKEKQRYEVNAGNSLASPLTPDACSGEQQRYKVTGQSRQKRRLTGCKNSLKGSLRLQRGIKQGGMGYLLMENLAISRRLMILKKRCCTPATRRDLGRP